MVRVGMLVLLLLAAGFSAGDASTPEPSETTETAGELRELRVETTFSKAPGEGPRRPSVILAPSASALSEELWAEVPDSGEGTYLISY